jgi:hypothetical protein
MPVHFHPIVRVVEYDPKIEFSTIGRMYTRPLEMDDLDEYEYAPPDMVDTATRILNISVDEGDVFSDDLSALFFSTMFTGDVVCRQTQDLLEKFNVRPVSWSDYRLVDIKGIVSPDAIRRYRNLIKKKYNIKNR